MKNETNSAKKATPDIRQLPMSERSVYKAGDTFVLPVAFQVLKILGQEDRVYYLCAPVEDAQRNLCLKDPFFVVCLEKNIDESTPVIPVDVITRAYDFVNLESGIDEADDKTDGDKD